jgi:hypothetical protein
MGGATSTSSIVLDTGSVAGHLGIDAPVEIEGLPSTGGSGLDVGASGSGGTGGRNDSSAHDAGVGGFGGSFGRFGDARGDTKLDADVRGPGEAGGGGGKSGKDAGAGPDGGVADGRTTVSDGPFDSALSDASCELCAIGSSLVHRYSFNGSSSTVIDSVGDANGTANNASLSGSGVLKLGGMSDQYVHLPDHVLSSLTSATLEVWVTWNGGNNNQRIVDFGSNELSGGKLRAVSTVLISPNFAIGSESPRLRAYYSAQVQSGSTFVDGTATLSVNQRHQIVAVFNGPMQSLSLYLDGALVGRTAGLGALSQINDNNNSLGKSQYQDEPLFNGTYDEFRIYAAPLTAAQVQAVYIAGADAVFQ